MVIQTIKTQALGEEVDVGKLLLAFGACSSRAEAKRLIRQGAVEIYSDRDSKPQQVGRDCMATIWDGSILHSGKSFWRELKLPPKKLTFEKQGSQVKILSVGA